MSWKLNAFLEPNYNGALLDALHVKGGFRIVGNQAQMLSIPYLYRTLNTKEATIVFVREQGLLYQLNTNPSTDTTIISDWTPIQLGGASSFKPVGTWNPYTNTPVLVDAAAVNRNGEFYFVENVPTQADFTFAELFQGQTQTLVNGNLVVSVGSYWVAISDTTTWDSMVKPQSITDYVNGIVISHTHTTADITDLSTYLTDYLKRSDTADHTIAFNSVPNSAIIELEFLKQWYYTKDEITNSYVFNNGITNTAGTVKLGGTLIDSYTLIAGQSGVGYLAFGEAGGGAPTSKLAGFAIWADDFYWNSGGTSEYPYLLMNDNEGFQFETGVSGNDRTYARFGKSAAGADFKFTRSNNTSISRVAANNSGTHTKVFLSSATTAGITSLNLDGNSATGNITITSSFPGFQGILYAADYSASFTDRSLVDKAYALSVVGGQPLIFGKGLTNTAGTITVGGTLPSFGSISFAGTQNNAFSWGTSIARTSSFNHFGYNGSHNFNLVTPVYNGTMVFENSPGSGEMLWGWSGDLNYLDNFNHSLRFLSGQGFKLYASRDGLNSNAFFPGTLSVESDFTNGRLYINSTITNFKGIVYSGDFSADYTSRSLVDKAYADTKAVVSGSNTYIQYNNNGALGSHVNLRYDFSKFNFIAAPITLTGGDIDWNNNAIFGEGHTIFTQPSGGGTVTDAAVFGWAHEIGDGTTWFGGSTGFTYGAYNKNTGAGCFVGGERARTVAGAQRAFIVALNAFDDTFPYVTVGSRAFNISNNSAAQTEGHGALALYSAILGGQDHNIPSDSPRSVILGGSLIKARAADPNQVYVPNFNITNTPANDDALTQILVRDATTGQIKYRTASSVGSGSFWNTVGTTTLTGVANVNGGTDALNFLFDDGASNTGNGYIGYDGVVYWLEKDNTHAGEMGVSNGVSTITTYLFVAGTVGNSITAELSSAGTFQVTSTGFAFPGIQYGADYSANYTARSLVDKAYVDLAVSDRSLKTNIKSLDDCLDVVNRMRAVEFDMISDGEHKVGFIAQELEEILPDIVVTTEDGIKKIKRDQLLPYLVKAIQELSSELNLLKQAS